MEDTESELATKLRTMLGDLRQKCKVIRTHRNKRLAHLDLKTALEPKAKLDNISVDMVEEVLGLVAEYMNTVEGHYCQKELLYERGISLRKDANDLVSILQDGLRLRKLMEDKKVPDDEMFKGEWADA